MRKVKLTKKGVLKTKIGDHWAELGCLKEYNIFYVSSVYYDVYVIVNGKNKETGEIKYFLVNLSTNSIDATGDYIAYFGSFLVYDKSTLVGDYRVGLIDRMVIKK